MLLYMYTYICWLATWSEVKEIHLARLAVIFPVSWWFLTLKCHEWGLVPDDLIPGEVLIEKSGGVVRPASQNPYPIYNQDLWFPLSYLWLEQNFDSLFLTVAAFLQLSST